MKVSFNSIGIIGGAGPEASSLIYKDIIEYCQINFNAKEDQDYPLIHLINYPFSSMINAKDSKSHELTIIKELQQATTMLACIQSYVIGIACNTLHNYQKHINFDKAQLVSIVDATLNTLECHSVKKALFLGTPTSVKNNLYGSIQCNIVYATSKNQKHITDIIYNILEGKSSQKDAKSLKNIIEQECSRYNVNSIILGCTELPILYRRFKDIIDTCNIVIFDTISILAASLIETAKK